MLDPQDEPDDNVEPDEKLELDEKPDDVDKHVPSACFVDPDGQGATFVLPELKLVPEL